MPVRPLANQMDRGKADDDCAPVICVPVTGDDGIDDHFGRHRVQELVILVHEASRDARLRCAGGRLESTVDLGMKVGAVSLKLK